MRTRLLLPAVLLLSGCPKLGDLGGLSDALDPYLPKVSFKKLSLQDIDWEHVEVDMVFDVENPAPLKVSLASFSYALALEGNDVLSGKDPDGLKLPAKDKAELTVPVSLTFDEIRSLLKDSQGKDDLGFVFSGDMGFDTPVGVAKLPYEATGDMPVLRTPKFSFQGIRVSELSLTKNKATIDVDLGVKNKGKANLSFADFDYKLQLDGTKVASGTVGSLGSVASGESTLTLPIDLELTSLGSAVVGLIKNGGNTSAGLKASMNVETPWGALPLTVDETGDVNIKP